MNIRSIFKLFALALLVGTLAGCSSGVKRSAGAETTGETAGSTVDASQQTRMSVSEIQIGFTDEAKEQYKDNIKFDPDALASTMRRALAANDLMETEAENHLRVTISDVRVRSNFSAVMFGFMAGSDHITGNVEVVDPNGTALDQFEISASYALGGFAGGQDGARMNWLYEKFAELAAKELLGDSKKTTTASN